MTCVSYEIKWTIGYADDFCFHATVTFQRGDGQKPFVNEDWFETREQAIAWVDDELALRKGLS